MIKMKASDQMIVVVLGIFFALSFFLYYVDFLYVSAKAILLLILVTGCLLTLNRKLPKDNFLKILLIFGIYSTILNAAFFSQTWPEAVYQLLLSVLIPYAIVYVIITLVDTEQKHKGCFYILIFLMFIQAIFIIGQFLNINAFWSVRTAISPLAEDTIRENMSRPVGLAYYAIDLSYQLVLLVPLSFAYFAKKKKYFLLLIPIIIILGSVLSLTRSSVFIILIAFLLFILSRHNKVTKLGLSFLFILLLIFSISFVSLASFERLTTLEDSSAQGRIVLFSQAIKSIREYPFGLGGGGYLTKWSIELTPHNQFLNIAAFYGIPSLVLLLLFTYLLFKTTIFEIKNAKNDYFRTTNFILLLSLMGFTFNSLFHNLGFFAGNSEVFIIIALILSSKRMRISQNEKTHNFSNHASI